MFCIVERFKRIYPIRVVHSAHSMCFRARAWSFYDFYGNTTQVRNIYGITISSFIVDINFTHSIATVCVCVFWAHCSFRGPFTLLLCARCLHCYVHELSSICATKCSTKQSTKIQYSFPQWACVRIRVKCSTFFCKFTCFWWLFFENFPFVYPFKIFVRPKRCPQTSFINDANRMCLRA